MIIDTKPNRKRPRRQPRILTESGYKPFRFLMYLDSDPGKTPKNWGMLDVPHHAPREVWEITTFGQREPSEKALIIDSSLDDEFRQTLFDVAVPVLKNVTIEDITRIIIDEKDIIDEFRVNFKLAIRDAHRQGSKATEIYHDVVRPKISRIERKFNAAANLGRLKAGMATVTSVMATLGAGYYSGTAAAITAVAGAAGVTAIINPMASAIQEKENIKDDYAYLLWKLRKQAL
ncbi:hypothetical protein [Lichenibacterium dinghuense]|uniref:hypothetical protein n=1 Tax=Lichenibacterium dinghuense TaxID=2895977 RepID=UPI001F2B09A6|nr:hypothetical protein [Lichenibacterium sp. 6Y81]